jgi:AraC-like DNA-binding protein
MERARNLLAATDAPLKEVADQLGFSEPSSFHRAFKRWTGETPTRYRLSHRSAAANDGSRAAGGYTCST